MPLKLLILANCQSGALGTICGAIVDANGAPVFDVLDIKPTHEWPLFDGYEAHVEAQLKACDVLLYQPHATPPNQPWRGSDYWISQVADSEKSAISFQSLYFSAYNPELSYLRQPNGLHLNEGFVDYHDKRLVRLFLQGASVDSATAIFPTIQPGRADVRRALEDTLQEMERREREQQLDIKVSDFIKANYQKQRLFWTFNHPANAVLMEVVRQLLVRLDIRHCALPEITNELLRYDVFPILPAVRQQLALAFDNDGEDYLIQGERYTAAEAVARYFPIYEKSEQWLQYSVSVQSILQEGWTLKKKVYFHVGQSKTGTTSFQVQLQNKRDLLLEHGILYPQTGLLSPSHMNVANHYMNIAVDAELIECLVDEIKSSTADTVIISCEEFEGLSEKAIGRLKADFSEFDPHIVNMLRDRVSWAVSMYSECVKKAAYLSSFNRLISKNITRYSKWKLRFFQYVPRKNEYGVFWYFHEMLYDRKRMAAWLAHFDKSSMTVVDCARQNVWQVFEALLSIEFSSLGIEDSKIANAKPSVLAVELARRFYRERNIDELQYSLALNFTNKLDVKFSHLAEVGQINTTFTSAREMQQFLAMYREDDDWLEQTFGFRRDGCKPAAAYHFYKKRAVDKVYAQYKTAIADCFDGIIRREEKRRLTQLPQLETAYLHIGTEIAGSRSIQHFLASNRALLDKQGVIFPVIPGEENHIALACYAMSAPISPFQQKVLSLLSMEEGEAHAAWKPLFQHRLLQELNKTQAESAIFSSEYLLFRLCKREEVQALQNLLQACFNRVRIIVYVRRQDLMATSLYNEELKAGLAVSQSFSEISGYKNNPFFQISAALALWGEVFGQENIDVRLFDKDEFVDNDLIKDFCAAADIREDSAFIRPERENRGLTGDTQKMLLLLNSHVNKNNKPIYSELQAFLIKHQNKHSLFPENRPSKQVAKALVEMFAAENAELSARWLGGRTFSDDFSRYDNAAVPCIQDDRVYEVLADKVDAFCTALLTEEKQNADYLADAYRDLALLFEGGHLEQALKLMEKAAYYRPTGPFILQKRDAFRQHLAKQ